MLIHDRIVRHYQREAWSWILAAFAEIADPVEPRVLLRWARIADERACRLHRTAWNRYADRYR